jgi:hypothetical protein
MVVDARNISCARCARSALYNEQNHSSGHGVTGNTKNGMVEKYIINAYHGLH